MFWDALLVGLVGVFCMLDSRLLGRLNFERPLIGATLTGLVLGDVKTGLLVGATLELVSLGLVHVGAAVAPDMVLGSIIAAAFAIISNATPETALTIAIPISVLGQLLGILLRTLLAALTHKADKFIEEGNFRAAVRMHIVWGPILYSLSYFIPIFAAIYFGTSTFERVVNAIPDWFSDGLTVASKLLPAYGFALLLNTMMDKKNALFFLAGFFITAYSGISITALSIFATILAFVLADVKFGKLGMANAGEASHSVSSNEDVFDELDLPDDK